MLVHFNGICIERVLPEGWNRFLCDTEPLNMALVGLKNCKVEAEVQVVVSDPLRTFTGSVWRVSLIANEIQSCWFNDFLLSVQNDVINDSAHVSVYWAD